MGVLLIVKMIAEPVSWVRSEKYRAPLASNRFSWCNKYTDFSRITVASRTLQLSVKTHETRCFDFAGTTVDSGMEVQQVVSFCRNFQ